MAEQVELDIDDAQEKNIEVEDTKPIEKVETPEVDLGYTDHAKQVSVETETRQVEAEKP